MSIYKFFKSKNIPVSYTSFCYMIKKLGSPDLAYAYYSQQDNLTKALNKKQAQKVPTKLYDKYQRLALSKNLNVNYIEINAKRLNTTKDIIYEEVANDDFEHFHRDPYLYLPHSEKVKMAINSNPKFLKMKPIKAIK